MEPQVKSVGKAEEVSVILTKQRDVAVHIETLVSNIGKANVLSRTAANRETKQKELDALWQLFQTYHETLRRDLPDDHPYLREKLSEATKKCVEKGIDKLKTWKSLKEKFTVTGAFSKDFNTAAEEREADSVPNPSPESGNVAEQSQKARPAPQRQLIRTAIKWKKAEFPSHRPLRQLGHLPTADRQRHIV